MFVVVMEKGRYKTTFTGVLNRVDSETGEIVSQKSVSPSTGGEAMPRFCLMFNTGFYNLFKVLGHEGVLLFVCVDRMDLNNEVTFETRDGWHKELYRGMTPSSADVVFRRSVRRLVDAGMLRSTDGGKRVYMINPECFYKGRARSYMYMLSKWQKLVNTEIRKKMRSRVTEEHSKINDDI
jgi:hypothetical protein